MSCDLKIGDRIECNGFKGTVKYIGNVDNTTGDWIGIDWDDHTRGKHDGSVDGKRYFVTKHPTSGSLIRAHKLSPRRSFIEALKTRYTNTSDVPEDLLHFTTLEGGDRKIELVGFEKVAKIQSLFNKLQQLDLRNMQISYCGSESKNFFNALVHVTTLNLSNNLFKSWSDVAQIITNLSSLTTLILSYNRLLYEKNQELITIFSSIKELYIDNLDYDWDDILQCASLMWPNINHLDLSHNKIISLREPKNVFNQLSYLNLSNNNISDWKEICKLGFLPNLNALDLENCKIKQIFFENVSISEKTSLFKQLKQFFIRNNQLSNWKDFAELNKLEKLEELTTKENPVFESEKYEIGFSLVLSKIHNLTKLNHEKINKEIRRDSEIYYLKRYYKDYLQSKINEQLYQEFLQTHPRFSHLISIYGDLNESEIDPKLELKKKSFLNLIFKCPSVSDEEIKKRIPASTSITNLKFVVRKLFKIDHKYNIKFVWVSKDFQYPLDNEEQNLNFYSIENDDIILINLD